VRELGAEIARDYEGLEPVLVGSLKASLVFIADLSRALPILHALDFVELAGYGSAQMGGHEQIRVLKDLDLDIRGRHVLVVEDVVDTGLTLNYLARTLELREPASVAAVTLLGVVQPWHVVVLAFMLGLTYAFENPATSTMPSYDSPKCLTMLLPRRPYGEASPSPRWPITPKPWASST